MSTVRFATLCDACGARSQEYGAWPTCRECGCDICPLCAVPGSKTDADVNQPETCYCQLCDGAYGPEGPTAQEMFR